MPSPVPMRSPVARPHESDLARGIHPLDAATTIHCEPQPVATSISGERSGRQDHSLHLVGATPLRMRIGNGADEETHCFVPGTVVLLGPNLSHHIAIAPPGAAGLRPRGLVLRFGDEPLRRGMKLFPELGDAGPLLARARWGVQFVGLGQSTLERFRRIEALQGLARFSEFTALLGELTQWSAYRLLGAAAPANDAHDALGRSMRIHKALDHIRDNYAEPLSLAEVGAVIGMRENTFSRSFRRATGQTFTEFVIGLRVAKACRLLASTTQQVSSICYEVGFNNISNFNRHFRRLKGMTPGEFRTAAARF